MDERDIRALAKYLADEFKLEEADVYMLIADYIGNRL